MNEKLLNVFFKIGLLLIGVAFLVTYFFHSQNGRYQFFIVDTESALGPALGPTLGPAKIVGTFDNRTGKMYRFEQERHRVYDYKNGEIVTRKTKRNDLDMK